MKKHLRSYPVIANELGIKLCTSCDSFNAYGHYKGVVDKDEEIIHWHRERMQRPGLYEFLKLCWLLMSSTSRIKEPTYLRVYEQSVFAVRMARELGIGIPQAVARNDRLHVRTQMPALPSTDPVYKWVHKENA